MTDVLSTCRSTWKSMGVPARVRADLEFELRTNLDAAAADGVDAVTFVGGDPSDLAREWALARGLVRSRWLVTGSVLTALVVSWPFLEVFRSVFVGRNNSIVPPFDEMAFGWSLLLTVVRLGWLLVPVLAAVGLYLRVVHDRLVVRTVVAGVAAAPVALWLSASIGSALESLGGASAEPLRISVIFALLLGFVRAAVVAADRRNGPRSAA